MKKIFCVLSIILSISASSIFIGQRQEALLASDKVDPSSFSLYNYSYYNADTMYGMLQAVYISSLESTGSFKPSAFYTINTSDSYIIEQANRVMENYIDAWESDLDYYGIYYTVLNNQNESYVQTSSIDLLNTDNQLTSDMINEQYFTPITIEVDASGEFDFYSLSGNDYIYENLIQDGDAKATVEMYILRDIIDSIINNSNYYIDDLGNEYYVSKESVSYANTPNMVSGESSQQVTRSVRYYTTDTTSNQFDMDFDIIYLNDLKFELNPISNVDIAFGFGKGIDGETLSFSYIDSIKTMAILIYPYLAIFGFLMMCLGLVLPIKWASKAPVLKHIKEIKLEVWSLIVLALIFLLFCYPLIYAYEYLGVVSSSLDVLFDHQTSIILSNLMIYGSLSILMFAGYILGYMIRYMFHVGVGYYIIHYSLILSLCVVLFTLIKDFLKDLNGFYSDNIFSKSNIMFVIFLSVNSLIFIVLYSPVFVFSYAIALTLIYLFINKAAKHDYNNLKQITSKIAQGDLNVEIKEDLGLYNDIKEDLTNIKQGFSKAVFEEVKSQRMKTELISNVSHDLKTPLTNIINYTDLLKSENLDEESRDSYIETVDRNSKRLKNLIDDLFEMSKLNSGEIALELQSLDMCNLIQQIYLEWEDKFNEKGLEVKYNFEQPKMIVQLDSYKAHRIIENLLTNIYKYAMANTRIYISAFVVADYVCVDFKNISAEEIDFKSLDVTDRFVRGDASRNTEGSGLGLAIAKSLTELHGGKLEVIVDGDLFKIMLKFPFHEI